MKYLYVQTKHMLHELHIVAEVVCRKSLYNNTNSKQLTQIYFRVWKFRQIENIVGAHGNHIIGPYIDIDVPRYKISHAKCLHDDFQSCSARLLWLHELHKS